MKKKGLFAASLHAAALAAACSLGAAPAAAADFVVTTKTAPALVYLFVVVPAAAEPGLTPYRTLYITDDKAACDAQAADWAKLLAPNKVVCLPHKQKVLKPLGASDGLDE